MYLEAGRGRVEVRVRLGDIVVVPGVGDCVGCGEGVVEVRDVLAVKVIVGVLFCGGEMTLFIGCGVYGAGIRRNLRITCELLTEMCTLLRL